MKVSHPIINSRISEYVKGILVIEDYQSKDPFVMPLFANGTPTLLFHTAKGQIQDRKGFLTLFGQTIQPGKLVINEKFTLVAYFLRPYSLLALFGIEARELTDKPVELNLLSDNSGLQEQLLNASSTKNILSLLDEHLFKLIVKSKTSVNVLKCAVEKIEQNPHNGILVNIQKEFKWTERTFRRMFHKSVGVSPNQFRKIHQFNVAFQQLNNRRFQNLSDVAFDNGYADQSHFIRTFKEFAGITPNQYLNSLLSR
jgi:AraC-like DNA-binding protein